jgi:Tfp pilus assembly protein FimV
MYQRAIRLDQLRAWPRLELARLYEGEGDREAAVRVLRSFLREVPGEAQATAMLSTLTDSATTGSSG